MHNQLLRKSIYQHRHLLILFLIVVIGFFLRLYNLGEKSLWQDEALFWQWADGLAIDDFRQGHHYSVNVYILILSVVNSVNMDESVMRLISAVSGAGAIPLFFLLGRKFIPVNAVLASSLFLALAPNQISESQQLREYSLTVFMTILIVYFFVRYMQKLKTYDLILFTLFSFMGIFTQVGLLFVIAGLGLTSFLLILLEAGYRNKKLLLGLGIYSVFIVFGGLWLWRFAYSQYLGFAADSYLFLGYWDFKLPTLPRFIWDNTWFTVNYAFNSKTDLFAEFLIIWGSVSVWKNRNGNYMVVGITFFPILITLIAGLTRVYPFIGSRHTIFLSIPLYILIAFGLNELFTYRRWLFGLAIGLFAFFLFQTSWIIVNRQGREEMRPIIETLCENVALEDHIYIHQEAIFAFHYYWRQCGLSEVDSKWDFKLSEIGIPPFYSNATWVEALSTKGDLWFVTSHLNEGELNQFLHSVAQDLGQRPIGFSEAPGAELFLLKND